MSFFAIGVPFYENGRLSSPPWLRLGFKSHTRSRVLNRIVAQASFARNCVQSKCCHSRVVTAHHEEFKKSTIVPAWNLHSRVCLETTKNRSTMSANALNNSVASIHAGKRRTVAWRPHKRGNQKAPYTLQARTNTLWFAAWQRPFQFQIKTFSTAQNNGQRNKITFKLKSA